MSAFVSLSRPAGGRGAESTLSGAVGSQIFVEAGVCRARCAIARSGAKQRAMVVRMSSDRDEKEAVAVKAPAKEKKATKTTVPAPLEYQPKKESFPELIWSRTMDTVEDVKLHLSRKYSPEKVSQTSGERPRVVVLGCGWGGHALVKTIDTAKYQVLVISPRNYFLFTPMLASSAAGTVEFRSICEPIRASNPYIDYIEATCTDIDHESRSIQCVNPNGDEFTIDYSYIVVAVGADTNTFGVPGVQQYCHFLKDIDDARGLRRSIIDQFERANTPGLSKEERARLLTFVIVGGGPTGTEFAAELSDFLKEDIQVHYKKLIGEVTVKLLSSGDSLLGQFDSALRDDALKSLQKNKIDVTLNARVVGVNETEIKLRNGDVVEYGVAVWAAGNGTRSLVRKMIDTIPDQSGGASQVLVDSWLRVKGTTSVFALGDCAVSDKDPLPATGQVAAQQGSYVARLLNRNVCLACEIPVELPSNIRNDISPEEYADLQQSMKNKKKTQFAKPFQFLSLGIIAYVGGKEAVADVDAGDVQVGALSGRLAFFLWRSVYLTKQVSTRNRILVLQDWIKTRLFGRDISVF